MIFHPQVQKKTGGSYIISDIAHATCHPCLCKPVFREFWQNFTFKTSELTVSECDEYVFSVGSAKKLALGGYSYSINVEKEGICLCGESEKDLINGFMTLLDLFKAAESGDRTVIEVECCEILDRAAVRNRMVHFCIFPETELWELERFVRFCGALKYTHIVLEFWGMLKYQCLKELSWDSAFSKEQIRPIISLAGDLGLEVIPMFNHWGHAPASRVMHGKHVVLDQDPTLQTYFSEDGWCWDIRKPKVRELLRSIRAELIELCGEGRYFHIGCDEAYNFEFTKENMDFICDFINEISREMRLAGRRILAWGDMFLFKHEHYRKENRYTCNAPSAEVEEYLLNGLDKDIIIADWQYYPEHFPVETASVFKKKGFDCLLCPWDTSRNHIKVMTETVKEEELTGLLYTTWHTLSKGMRYVLVAAVYSFEHGDAVSSFNTGTYAAALMRKVMPANGDYRSAGWSRSQIGFSW